MYVYVCICIHVTPVKCKGILNIIVGMYTCCEQVH